jgi:hypothetical protein
MRLLRTIGSAAEFFLNRHWQRTVIGPYVLTTVEVRWGVYESSVTWGDGGPEVDLFGSGQSFDKGTAEDTHAELSEKIKREVGPSVAAAVDFLPPAA